jgi:hypothetical protein
VWWKLRSRFVDRNHRQLVSRCAALARHGTDEALAKALDVELPVIRSTFETDSLEQLLGELTQYGSQDTAVRMGGAAFLEGIYAVVRLARPQTVLETGVAHGYSSAVILQAIADNRMGKLHSVDLPTFSPGAILHTGGAIPKHLRSESGWELTIGPDRQMIPPLLDRIGLIDFFHYDSDKSYAGMRFTMDLVWPHLRPGALLMMDDVHSNDAFLEFADIVGVPPVIVAKPTRRGVYQWDYVYYVGMLRKP